MYVGYVWKRMMKQMICDDLVADLLKEWRKSDLFDRGMLPEEWEKYFEKAQKDMLAALPPELKEPYTDWEKGWYAELRRVALRAFCAGTGLYFQDHYTGVQEEAPFERWWRMRVEDGQLSSLYSEKAFLESAQWLFSLTDNKQRRAVADAVRRLNRAWRARERGVAGAAFCVGYHNGMVSCLDHDLENCRLGAVQKSAGMAGAFFPEHTDLKSLEL